MATTTPNLALLKKDPVADGADTFNIETMLNENWDKVDAAYGGFPAAAETVVAQHNASGSAHADIRAAMFTASVQFKYNMGGEG